MATGRVEQLPARQERGVEICTRTRQVSGGYRVPVRFVIPHKNHIKIISLISKVQYTHAQN
jgi:hypothetical protein